MLDELSKRLAFLLRHDKSGYEKGKIDINGWRSVKELCSQGFTEENLNEIVKTDTKGRYEFSEDNSMIRAVQGHSIPVNVNLVESQPPDILYHGTSSRFLDSILSEGIKSGSRIYVHLSKNIETAINVGKRHGGKTVVLEVESGKMYKDGIKFFISKNGVWLVDYVLPEYIKIKK